MKKLTALLILLLSFAGHVFATDLFMVRSQQKFPEAMLTLQQSIGDHGYKITRVQRIDVGLTAKGYKTDKYRVVFLGKVDEIHYLIGKYPLLAAYLPPKVSIFAEGDSTMLVTANPAVYADLVTDSEDKILFKRWESDIHSVFKDVREAE